MPYVIAEVEYDTETHAYGRHTVHSDIGPSHGEPQNMHDSEYREYLHANLEEWLDNSEGTGIFYITGETEKYFPNAEEVEGLHATIASLKAEIAALRQDLTDMGIET